MLWYFYSLWQKNTSDHTASWLAFLAVVSVKGLPSSWHVVNVFYWNGCRNLEVSGLCAAAHSSGASSRSFIYRCQEVDPECRLLLEEADCVSKSNCLFW